MKAEEEELDTAPIRARANAATPGPWKQGGKYDGEWREMGSGSGGVIIGSYAFYAVGAPNYHYPDAEFIAHARTDVTALLDEVARLRYFRNRTEQAQDLVRRYIPEATRLEDENQRLTKIIKDAPHGAECSSLVRDDTGRDYTCDCWKAEL